MKKMILFIFLLTVVFSIHNSKAQFFTYPEKLGPTAPYVLSNSNLGTDFWVAIPTNDKPNGVPLIAIEIKVCALKKTEVMLQSGDGVLKIKTVEAMDVVTFTSKVGGEASVNWEVNESQVNLFKGVHITSKEPVAVYVSNIKKGSADGYMAIPVSSWGTDYYSCSYYDFSFSSGTISYEGGGGFIVLASEPQTQVTINLKATGGSAAKTIVGQTGGQVLKTSLNAGEVYMVRGQGKTLGQVDFSGTHITSSKPIGVISFHSRTMIPSFCSEGASALSEMMVPTWALGTKYLSVQYDRQRQIQGNGDFFRFLGISDNTTVTGKWYDMSSMSLVGQTGPTCKNPGDFAEYNQTDLDQIWPITNNTSKAVIGTSVFTSEKPFYCMQYNYSKPWDWADGWFPNMTLLTPTNQYIPASIFYVGGESFNNNFISFIAQGDPGDPQNGPVRSISVDGTPIQVFDSKTLVNIIPETDYYWGRHTIDAGFHSITSQTKLTGFASGRGNQNAYGWTFAKGLNKLDEPDAEPPVIKTDYSCGVFTITASENKNTPTQKDQGISKVIFFSDSSSNVTFALKDSAKFKPQMKVTSQVFTLNVKDFTKPAIGYYAVLDRAGNYIIDSVLFNPENISLQSSLDIGNTRVGRTNEKTITMKNNGLTDVKINYIKLSSGTSFKIKNSISLPASIVTEGSISVPIIYSPTHEAGQLPDIDTLTIETDCKKYKSILTGKGVLPHIFIEDFNFGQIQMDSLVCIEIVNQRGLKIDNTGKDTLNIFAIDSILPPFYNTTKIPTPPFAIPPGGTVYFKSICFWPKDSGEFNQDIKIHSDGGDTDSSFKLTGQARKKPINSLSDAQRLKGKLISINPNPAYDGSIDIEFASDEINNIKIEICDISGRIFYSMEFNPLEFSKNKISLDISLFDTGVYFMKYSSGRSFECQKLIVSN
ncbi:MAG: IgGFc-binding protein-like [Ignavibacteria bacterium]|nr:IgGFc-binding protein-like [Ignavibacteria bacterium]